MKKYVKPVFIAESYMFADSIAACGIDIDTTKPLVIKLQQTNLCSNGNDGHVYGGSNGNKGEIAKLGRSHPISPATIFNDADKTWNNDETNPDGCTYDWDGRTNIVAQTQKNFAESFYGNNSNEDKHSPGYVGQSLLS